MGRHKEENPEIAKRVNDSVEMSVQLPKCLCCRVNIEGFVPEEFQINDQLLNKFYKYFDITEINNLDLSFAWFCHLLEIPKDSSVASGCSDLNLEFDKQVSPLCSRCSELIISLRSLQDVLEKITVSIQQNLLWVKNTVMISVATDQPQNDNEDDPRFCYIRAQIQSIQQDKPSEDNNNTDDNIDIDNEVEIKQELLDYDDHFEATQFELEGFDEQETLEAGTSSIVVSDVNEVNNSTIQRKSRCTLLKKSTKIKMDSDEESCILKNRPIRQKKKSYRLVESENSSDVARNGANVSDSDKKLLAKNGFDKLPEVRIELEDIAKVPLIKSESRSSDEEFECELRPDKLKPSRATSKKINSKNKRTKSVLETKNTKSSNKRKFKNSATNSLSNVVSDKNVKEDSLQFHFQELQDPDFQPTSSSDDSSNSDSVPDSESNSETQITTSKAERRSANTMKRKAKESSSITTAKKRRPTKRRSKDSTIVIENGKRYYNKQEIVEEGDNLLCFYKNCNFKLLKDEDDTKSCEKMLKHLTDMDIHPNDCKYYCKECDMTFQKQREYFHHKTELHPRSKRIECAICQRPLSNRTKNYRHQWSHLSSEERAAWVASGKSDPTERYLRLKEQQKQNPSFQCSECGKIFSAYSCLQAHEKNHIDKKDRPKIPCDKEGCSEVFTTKRGLHYHVIRVHNPEAYLGKWKICKICPDVKFLVRTQLAIHMRRHHGAEKIHKCEVSGCGKSFPDIGSLKNHAVAHMPDHRPYQCQFCTMAYRYPKNLKRHVKSAHYKEWLSEAGHLRPNKPPPVSLPVMTCVRMWPCEICDNKYFPMPSRLKKHMTAAHGHKYVYDNEKPVTTNLQENSSNQGELNAAIEFITNQEEHVEANIFDMI